MDKFEIASSLFRAYRFSFEKANFYKSTCPLTAERFKGECDGIRNAAIFLDVVDLFDNVVAVYEMGGYCHE